MKTKTILSIILGVLLFFGQASAAEQNKVKKDRLKGKKQQISYSLGYDTGRMMKHRLNDIDIELFIEAFREGVAGKSAAMSEEEMRAAVQPLMETAKAKRAEAVRQRYEKNVQLAENNKTEGAAYLAENAKKDGVVRLPSGLQYKIVKEGTGRSPQKTDKVKVNYRGTLIDGKEFDSSYKRNEPGEFELDKVVKGWGEALQLMKEGAQWTIYIPPDLAYGARSAGPDIGPNQTLIFDVELIAVQ